jgi:hypothetical protein
MDQTGGASGSSNKSSNPGGVQKINFLSLYKNQTEERFGFSWTM